MKQWSSYIWKVIKKALSPSFNVADIIATVAGAVGGLIAYLYPRFQEIINIGLWAIPLGVFLTITLIRLFFAPYFLYLEEKTENDAVKEEIKRIKQSKPNIIFDQIRESPLYRKTPVSDKKVPMYHVIQTWFINSPEIPSIQSEAKGVSAIIEFWHEQQDRLLFSVYGQWAKSTAPDHVGFSGSISEIDIPPSNLPVKLLIALKHPTDEECYGYSLESITRSIDGRDQQYKLDKGNYRICIILRGFGIQNNYWFLLRNPGSGKSLVMETLSEKK